MLAKRIIPCLDVQNGKVVKGIQFRKQKIVGDIVELAEYYCEQGADELVFYDITASANERTVDTEWIRRIAYCINIPFCVAGGINSLIVAEKILNSGAEKISINSKALANPDLINELSETFGKQCVVIGIDSLKINDHYQVLQYTGDEVKTINSGRYTVDWIKEVEVRGAGEIVLNCINQDGMQMGYDCEQLALARRLSNLPLIASGGAGSAQHFLDVFNIANVNGALAASIFHSKRLTIPHLKEYLSINNIEIRR